MRKEAKMIAACPKCGAKYRVDETKISAEGARLRCAKCQAVFRVRAPQASAPAAAAVADPAVAQAQVPPAQAPAPATEAPAPAAAPPQVETPAVAPPQVEAPAAASDEIDVDPERSVLVADPDEEAGKLTASAVASWGLQPLLVHDGVEAMMTIQRSLPRVVVLDAALPKMFGFQICEVMKRNESLANIKVVLVGAIHNEERYRRPPTETYGADVYLEQPDLPDGLKPLLQQFGLPLDGAAPAASQPAAVPPAPEPAAAPVTEAPASQAESPEPQAESAAPQAPPQPTVDPALAEDREKAERLARIIVSDIVLYQGEKFDQAIQNGNLLEMLDAEVEEGRKLFRQRVDEAVRDERDHLLDELMRVARERGMQ